MKKLILIFLFVSTSLSAQYALERAFPNVGNFFVAMEMTNAGDGSGRLFLAERRGLVSVFKIKQT